MEMKKYKQGYIAYNPEIDRYGLLIMDLWEKEFHCGNHLQILVDGKWQDTSVEFNWSDENWYLVGTPYRGKNIYLQARVFENTFDMKRWLE